MSKKKLLLYLCLAIMLVTIFFSGCSVTTPIAVTGVTLNKATMTLIAGGDTGALVATLLPAEATNKDVTWTSSNPAVATVTGGVVTPLTEGVTTIIVSTVDGGKTATCEVTVISSTIVVNIAAIPGIKAPLTGGTPVTEITPTDQYTGTVTWDPADDPFTGREVYTATITLSTKEGFTLTGVASDFFTVAGAITTNLADSGVVTAVFPITLVIGDEYQGGKIAYILQSGDPGYDESVQKGLIAAAEDQSTGIVWSNISDTSVGPTGTALGTGKDNTIAIVSQAGCNDGAAYICDNLEIDGYDDWFLPSKDEFNKLFINQDAIGGFGGSIYWSSSEWDFEDFRDTVAWVQFIAGGEQQGGVKTNTNRVRAVRYF